MATSRRKFIGQSALLGLLPVSYYLTSCKNEKQALSATNEKTLNFTLKDFGIQLWTVKEAMAKDAKATLTALSQYGYTQIESFNSANGIFWGMKPMEFKNFLADHGLTMVSSHVEAEISFQPEKMDGFKKVADEAAAVGAKYLVNPYLGGLKTKDEFSKAIEGMNVQGQICKDRGMGFAYHNHDYSFINNNGFMPIQLMLDGTNADLVNFEMDLYWVAVAKQDPIEWLNKYPGRFKLSHIKDLYKPNKIAELIVAEKTEPGKTPSASCVLGTGAIDFNNVLQKAKENGMELFFVEQERFDNSTPMEDAAKDATYMKQFKV